MSIKKSALINGFSSYQEATTFFQNISQKLKQDGVCNIGGNVLLDRFCEQDGITNRRVLKNSYLSDGFNTDFNKLSNLNDIENIVSKYDKTNVFINNSQGSMIRFFKEELNHENNDFMFIKSGVKTIVFGIKKNAPFYKTWLGDKAFFILTTTHDGIKTKKESLYETDSEEKLISVVKKILDRELNPNFYTEMDDDHFLQYVRMNKNIMTLINQRRIDKILSRGEFYFYEKEIREVINAEISSKKVIGKHLFTLVWDYFNQTEFLSVIAFQNEEDINYGCDKAIVIKDYYSFLCDIESDYKQGVFNNMIKNYGKIFILEKRHYENKITELNANIF